MADVLRFDIAKDPKGNPITYGRVGDTDGLTRSVKVFEDGKPLDLTGYVITFEGNTSKYRTKVFDTGGVELVDATKGEFTYTFPNMAFAVEGQYERAYFSFAKSDTRKTTGDFEIIVFGNSDIDAAEAETIITEYNRLVAELHALQEQNIAELQELQDEYIASTDQAFADIVGRINSLKSQIDEYEQTIDSKASEVLTIVANALAEFEAGDFYTKAETMDVINQLDWQKYPLTQSDGTAKYFPSITPVPNSLADITETGTWYLTANQFNSLIEETTVPTDLRGGGWLIVLPFTGSADLRTVYQMWLSNTSSEGKNRRPIIRYWAESKGAPSDWVELASTQALNTHISNTSNPHGVTKNQVGLGNVPNYAVASIEEAEDGTADDKLMTPLKVSQLVKEMMLDLTYPIGTIYTSVTQTNPAELFGGTWERFAQGRMLIGIDENDTDFSIPIKTGGAKTHQLKHDELPAHRYFKGDVDSYDHDNALTGSLGSGSIYGVKYPTVGRSLAHNNMPPYITVYMWERIS